MKLEGWPRLSHTGSQPGQECGSHFRMEGSHRSVEGVLRGDGAVRVKPGAG